MCGHGQTIGYPLIVRGGHGVQVGGLMAIGIRDIGALSIMRQHTMYMCLVGGPIACILRAIGELSLVMAGSG